jgi:hypothetical protein
MTKKPLRLAGAFTRWPKVFRLIKPPAPAGPELTSGPAGAGRGRFSRGRPWASGFYLVIQLLLVQITRQ